MGEFNPRKQMREIPSWHSFIVLFLLCMTRARTSDHAYQHLIGLWDRCFGWNWTRMFQVKWVLFCKVLDVVRYEDYKVNPYSLLSHVHFRSRNNLDNKWTKYPIISSTKQKTKGPNGILEDYQWMGNSAFVFPQARYLVSNKRRILATSTLM